VGTIFWYNPVKMWAYKVGIGGLDCGGQQVITEKDDDSRFTDSISPTFPHFILRFFLKRFRHRSRISMRQPRAADDCWTRRLIALSAWYRYPRHLQATLGPYPILRPPTCRGKYYAKKIIATRSTLRIPVKQRQPEVPQKSEVQGGQSF
jgi:hypothetical protein